MYGIVRRGTDIPTFDDKEVKRQISADANLSNKLATVSSVFKDALKAEPEPKYEEDTSSSSSSASDPYELRQDSCIDSNGAHAVDQKHKRHRGKFRASPATILNHLLRASVRPGTWIYVADTVGRLYVGIKSSGAFQHASFLSGARISSAGTIGIVDGKLRFLSPLSGHYRPTTQSFRSFIASLKAQGADTSSLRVSKAYSVLLGMEFYGTSKRVTKQLLHPNKEAISSHIKATPAVRNEPSTEYAGDADPAKGERRRHVTPENDKRGLAKLMDDFHVRCERRRSEFRKDR